MKAYAQNKHTKQPINIRHLHTKERSNIILWKTREGNFLGPKNVDYPLLPDNDNYTLITKRYAPVLEKVLDQVSFRRGNVVGYRSKEICYTDYIELDILNTIGPDSIKSCNSQGLKIWHMKCYVFVSGELKKLFLKLGQEELRFSPGFSGVGGGMG